MLKTDKEKQKEETKIMHNFYKAKFVKGLIGIQPTDSFPGVTVPLFF